MRNLNTGFVFAAVCVLLTYPANGTPPTEVEQEVAAQFLLHFQGRGIKDDDGQVIGLNLKNCNLQPGDPQTISQFKYLTSLNLSGTSIRDDDVAEFAKLSRLNSLDLSNTQISNAALVHVVQLKLLTELSLSSTSITDEAIPELARLPLLQRLNLSRTSLTDGAAQSLATLSGLISIKLSETPVGDPVLDSLGKLPLLRSATLGGTKVTEAGLARSAQLEQFQWMETDEAVVREFARRVEAGDAAAVENMLEFGLRMPHEGTFRTRSVELQTATGQARSQNVSRWRVEWDWNRQNEEIGLFVQILIQQRSVTITAAGILE